jgi:hypothetical protein
MRRIVIHISGTARAYVRLSPCLSRLESDTRRRGGLPLQCTSNAFALVNIKGPIV